MNKQQSTVPDAMLYAESRRRDSRRERRPRQIHSRSSSFWHTGEKLKCTEKNKRDSSHAIFNNLWKNCDLCKFRLNGYIEWLHLFLIEPGKISWLDLTENLMKHSGSNLSIKNTLYRLEFKRLAVIHTYIHILMAVAAMQVADQQIRRSLRFGILPKDTLTCTPGELNQHPSDNKTQQPTKWTSSCTEEDLKLNWGHKLIRSLLIEITNQERNRLFFFISLHRIRLLFETFGDAPLHYSHMARLNSTAQRRHLSFWYWVGIVCISLNLSQTWQIVDESLRVQWCHLTPKVYIQAVGLIHFSDPEALPLCHTVNGPHAHIFRHQCMKN